MPNFLKNHKAEIIFTALVLLVVLAVEYFMGRLPLGPDGRFGFWEGNIWSSENSQRLLDPYSLTHVVHGFAFYFLLWIFARKLPTKYRLIAAVILESAWEILENSPLIINRYREVTISLGYVGDSILNSMSDVVMMALGFLMASRFKVWQSILAVVAIEVGLLLWVKDNLTLNLIMLIHPVDAIKSWQAGGRPIIKLK